MKLLNLNRPASTEGPGGHVLLLLFLLLLAFFCQAALTAQAGPFGPKVSLTALSAKTAQINENENNHRNTA